MAVIKTEKFKEIDKKWKDLTEDPFIKDMMDSPETLEDGSKGFDSRRDEDICHSGPLHGICFPHKPNYRKVHRVFPAKIAGHKCFWLYRKLGKRGHRMRRIYLWEPCPFTAHTTLMGAWPYDYIKRTEHLEGGSTLAAPVLPDEGSGIIKPTYSIKESDILKKFKG